MTGTTSDRLIDRRRTRLATVVGLAAGALLAAAGARAQVPVDADGNPISDDVSPLDDVRVENPVLDSSAELSAADLDELIGPIALYPDDLLAIVLPASTYPLQIVQAARYLEQVEVNPALEPDEEWDDSVVALLNYPDVLNMMNEDIDWTWSLGEAVVRQQSDVILAIESFRDRAYAAGNLKTDEYQTVSVDDEGIIEIEPASDDVIYVPYYEPERVVYYSPTPVYHYYATPYPVYYYPYPRHHRFRSGFFWGVTTAFTIGWATDHLHVYHHSYHGHPYYGRYYDFYGSYWRRPSISIYNSWYVNTRSPYYHYRHKRGDYWRPRNRAGARPRTKIIDSRYRRDRDLDRDYHPDRRGDSIYDSRSRRDHDLPRIRGERDRVAGGSVRDNRRRDTAATPTRRGSSATDRRSIRRTDDGEDRIRFRPRGDGAYTVSPERSVRATTGSRQVRRDARATTPTLRSRTPARTNRAPNVTRSETPRRDVRRSTPRREGFSAPRQSRPSTSGRVRQSVPTRRTQNYSAPRQSRPAPARSQRQSAPARRTQSSATRQSRPSASRPARTTKSGSRRASGNRDRSPRRERPKSRN